MKRTLNIALSAVFAGSAVLAGSHMAFAGNSAAGAAPPKLAHGITLKIWDHLASPSEVKVEQQVADQWAAKYGDTVQVQTNVVNPNNKFLIGAPTGNAPDIIGLPHDQVAQLQAGKVLAPFPSWAWTAAQKKLYISGAVKATNLGGKTYAMPWSIETTGMFYNKALVPASALKPAKGDKFLTWKKIIPVLQKATNVGAGKFGFVFDPTNFYYDYAFISGYGGYVFKYNAKKGYDWNNIGLANAGSVKGIQFIKDLTTNGKYKLMTDTMTGNTGDGLFEKGQVAVDYTGPWNEATFAQDHVNYGFAPLPSYDGKHALHPFSTVEVYSVNAFSKYKNEAFSLVSYMTQHMQLGEFKASGRIPVLKKLINSKTVQRDPVAGALAKAAVAAAPMPNIQEMAEVWTPAGNAIGQAAQNKATPKQAATVMVQQIKAAIAKAHGG